MLSYPIPNHIAEAAGLLPFLIIALVFQSWIAWIVVTSGALYHGFQTSAMKILDVATIFVLVLYVNFVSKSLPVFCLTCTSIMFGIGNARQHVWFYHTFGVQLPLAIALVIHLIFLSKTSKKS